MNGSRRAGVELSAPRVQMKYAPVMELVDMRDLGSRAFSVWVRVPSGAPKCVDERCNAENAARKCGVFAYNAPLLERKSCKNSFFQNFSFAPREATFLRFALPNLWSGVVRTPRLKKE